VVSKLKRIFGGIGIAILVLVLGYMIIRPWLLSWGATPEEVTRAMPGDLNGSKWTRAVTVNAAAEQIWPWLVQWGQGRGGWYSYDWLENLFGFNIHTATQILPQYQTPAVGDPICMASSVCTSFVSVVEPNQWFGWQARDDKGKPVWNFIFGLFPVDSRHTRLVVRESFDPNAMPQAVTVAIEIPDVVMEQKALDTVRRRAEGLSEPALTTPAEIILWLAALVIWITAEVLLVNRKDWKSPLAIGIASVLVLIWLTFMFLPLWLRGLLDLGLLGGVVWAFRRRGELPAQVN
jgi:hypothetical protein